MKSLFYQFIAASTLIIISLKPDVQEFQGQAIYFSKAKMLEKSLMESNILTISIRPI